MNLKSTLVLAALAVVAWLVIRNLGEPPAPPPSRTPLVPDEILAGLEEIELRLFSGELLKVKRETGGHFVMEGYHKSQLQFTSGGPKSFDLLFDLEEVLGELTGPNAPPMTVVHAAVEETVLDESDLHRGRAAVVRFHLQRTG